MRRVLILGSTGSIGMQALDVVERSDDLCVVGLSAASRWEALLGQAQHHGVARVAVADEDLAAEADSAWTGGQVLAGHEGIATLIAESEPDIVLNGLMGSAGLGPTVAALSLGIDVALANKESLVVGGELVMQLAEAAGAQLIPVDSEHSALFQLLRGEPPGVVDTLILTASGGPFRGMSAEELRSVSAQAALQHPTWDMGGKITIDSATLMNKGLETIEAHHLFGFPYSQIEVVVHPESIVHAVVQMNDGASLAHLGSPDMRVPISYALHFPERADVTVAALDLVATASLTFEEPDTETFRCLALAREAARAGGTAPCVLNAANEVAVHAFLSDKLGFLDIARVVEGALEAEPAAAVSDFEDLYEADALARDHAAGLVERLAVQA